MRRGFAILSLTLLATVLACAVAKAGSAQLTVEIVGATDSNGVIKIAVWTDERTFLKGQPFRIASAEMKDGRAIAVFKDMESGMYAVSAYHDKNNNGKLDTNLVGKPTEPYGFSNDARRTFGPPKYDEARFDLGTQGLTITLHLK
jgi:uncharacterized protein (DUF2141 family)